MFLGINEMKYTKAKYVLIILVIVMITWLIAILSGLANGLQQGNRLAVDQWQAKTVIVTKESNKNLNASSLTEKEASSILNNQNIAAVAQAALAIRNDSSKDSTRTNTSFFGVSNQSFLKPKVTSGKLYQKKNEVVLSADLKEQGYKIGDKIYAGTYKTPLEIVGWTKKSTYNIVPVIYTSIETIQAIKGQNTLAQENKTINGLVVRKKSITLSSSLKEKVVQLDVKSFIEALPGYQAQNLTLDTMIYFLIIIASFVIGIFIYIMTLQKTAMFGVLKVQGVPTNYLVKSVISQTGILAVLGVAIGLILTAITVQFLPNSMPYTTNYLTLGLNSLLLIIIALLGGFISTRTIKKIDPLVAIGG